MGHDTARDTSARDTSGTTIPGTASTAGVGETTEKGEKPSKMHAFLEKAKGTVEKTVGKLTGSTTMQATGEERKFAAETERAAADANRGGATERASGRVERDAGVMAGQPGMASEGEMRREKGAAKQSGMMGAGGERDVGAGTTEGTPAGTETPAAGAAGSGFRGDPLVEKQYL
ncbi:hypothetical protein HK104_001587 [Borealophlyctis nickersoniae]|nr:hypothetical protein HK104_001587 [Borealophlyctis nickersoniae]